MLALERALKYRDGKRGACGPVALVMEDVVGRSRAMRACFDAVAGAAGAGSSVLITGETGTGKELFARTIHANSARAARPFVVVDCAALTETLVESTLFGHRKGAFTGADTDRVGLVKLADGGTLFLDEVGEMPLNLQKAFLRVLQERRFRPVGASAEMESDFRLMAATNRDLERMVEQGGFRNDLLYRIKTISIPLPPLRERVEDIKPLCVFRVGQLCEQYGLPLKGFDQDFFHVLEGYAWPGNVRELFNVLERAFVSSGSERTLYAMHLPQDVRIKVAKASLRRPPAPGNGAGNEAPPEVRPDAPAVQQSATQAAPQSAPQSALGGEAWPELTQAMSETLKAAKDEVERRYLEALLRRTGGDMQKAVEVSGLSRSHLYALLKKWGLSTDGPGIGTADPV
jgi:two-component system NtrC family response regulator